jgi:hypothetical protein
MQGRHVERYWATGFVTIRGVFAASEVDRWAAESERMFEEGRGHAATPRLKQLRRSLTGGLVLDRFDDVLGVSPLFRELASDPRLHQLVAPVLGGAPVPIRAKLIAKHPGTVGYGMHQDFPYWEAYGIPADRMITALVGIDGAASDNGATEVFPGLHHGRIPPPPDDPRDADESLIDLTTGRLLNTGPGDVALFHPLTPHRSGPNRSERSRRAVFFTYAIADCLP